ncbi:hypothetical protein ACFSMW_20140 [Virgibacillus halophilus]|uniref:DinB superfamily protein n=1 Tax=Tigheibacillus halophilus TaxID=361280 RepID=A0ABU5C8V7_9BACI|nr:hypothetical protein [Virgibacillus halophilus]
MAKSYLRILWVILTLIPAPYLFHFYEYGQFIKHKEAPFLFLASILFVLIVGFLSCLVKIRYVVLIHILVAITSVVLAINFISDDGGQNWKKTKQEYFSVHRELGKILAKSDYEDLYREIPGEDNSLVLELKSLGLHDAYHIGQIVFLSKMQGAWPGKRNF